LRVSLLLGVSVDDINIKTAVGSNITHDDESLSRAIEASLTTSYKDFEEEPLPEVPEEDWVRKDERCAHFYFHVETLMTLHRPTCVRTTKAPETYAALALHALFFIPQFRDAVFSLPDSNFDDLSKHEGDECCDYYAVAVMRSIPLTRHTQLLLSLLYCVHLRKLTYPYSPGRSLTFGSRIQALHLSQHPMM
jgi:hypothetical protein